MLRLTVAIALLAEIVVFNAYASVEIDTRNSAAISSPFSSSPNYAIRHWKTTEGLPANRIECLTQTRDGCLWIGSPNGLVLFDGAKFRICRDIACTSLCEDFQGALWIGTAEGLFRWSNRELHSLDLPPAKGAYPHKILAITPHKDGGVWIAYAENLIQVDEAGVRKALIPLGNSARSIQEDRDGLVWTTITTERYPELYCWNPQRPFDRFSPHARNTTTATTLLIDSSGAIWLGCPGEPHRRNTGGEISFHPKAGEILGWIWSIAEDATGTIWLGCTTGLWKISSNGLEKELLPDGHSFSTITSLASDRVGGLWIGTESDGIYHLCPQPLHTFGKEAGLPCEDVWTICEASDRSIWIGTQDGIARFKDGETRTFSRDDGLQSTQIRAITEDSAGRIWVGSERQWDHNGGLSQFRNGRFVSYGTNEGVPCVDISSLVVSKDGTVWIAGGNGATSEVVAWRKGIFERILEPDQFKVLFVDAANKLWASGAADWIFRNGWWQKVDFLPSVRKGAHGAFHEDSDGAIWFCSQYSGVIRYKNGRSNAITSRIGLCSDLVLSMLEDDFGRYWFGTHAGIFWVYKKDLNEVADGLRTSVKCVRYGLADGMRSEEGNGGNSPNACKTKDGRLWFPTTKGVVVVRPQEKCWDDAPVAANIEEVTADGQLVFNNAPDFCKVLPAGSMTKPSLRKDPIKAAEALVHPGHGHSLYFRFGSAAFEPADRVSFRFRLKGKDPDWTEIGSERFVRCRNLAPGHYIFQLMAANMHGVWNDVPTDFAFYVAPFFYQTSIFYLSSAVALATALAGIAGYRTKVQRRIAKLEKEAALGRERERIARDLHDDLGASLTRIAMLSDIARQQTNPEQAASTIEGIATISRNLVDSISELIWAANPKYDNLQSMLAYFREYCAQSLHSLGINLRFERPTNPHIQLTAEIRRELFLVLKEALNNIAKHSKATEVQISVTAAEKHLHLQITDNGKGMRTPSSPSQSTEDSSTAAGTLHRPAASPEHGLDNMRHRVQKLGGTFSISSPALSSGSTILVIVPF